jgi:membrane protein involved in colicin uptake
METTQLESPSMMTKRSWIVGAIVTVLVLVGVFALGAYRNSIIEIQAATIASADEAIAASEDATKAVEDANEASELASTAATSQLAEEQAAAAAEAARVAAEAQAAAEAAAAEAARQADLAVPVKRAPSSGTNTESGPVKCPAGTKANAVDAAGNESACEALSEAGETCQAYDANNVCTSWYKP